MIYMYSIIDSREYTCSPFASSKKFALYDVYFTMYIYIILHVYIFTYKHMYTFICKQFFSYIYIHICICVFIRLLYVS